MSRFDDKTVLITGGASGIGLGTARRIVAEGGAVAVLDRQGDAIEAAVAQLTSTGGRAKGFEVDVTDAEALEAAAVATRDEFGSIDGLFASAGIRGYGRGADTELDWWKTVIDIDLTGVFLSIRAVLPIMIEQDSGAIVAASSVSAIIGASNQAPYTAAKAGVIALCRQIALDYGSHHIRVNSICPGTVKTPLSQAGYTIRAGGDPEKGEALLEERAKSMALGRLGTPEDVAALVSLLLSDEGSWITGANYLIDGGMTIGTTGARSAVQ